MVVSTRRKLSCKIERRKKREGHEGIDKGDRDEMMTYRIV